MADFRKLWPADLGALQRHLLALRPDERRLRFHGSASDLAIERYCRRIDWFRLVAVGYFVDGRLRGVAQVMVERPLCPRAGELAVTVETPWQRHGVGTELVRRAVTLARNRGLERLVMTCLVENQPMRRILRRLGAAQRFEGAAVMADLDLNRATPFTLFEELLADGAGGLAAVHDRLWAPAPGR
jgi:RimJ/RimL family protein N-acetyltransferase